MRVWEKNRGKISNTLHVIPVKVGKKEVVVSGFVGQRITISSYPKSSIKQEEIIVISKLDTGRMGSKNNLILLWNAN
jgi:hypothetical protein